MHVICGVFNILMKQSKKKYCLNILLMNKALFSEMMLESNGQ